MDASLTGLRNGSRHHHGEDASGAWRRLANNWLVRIGGSVLTLLILVSLLAPWLGAIDPNLLDSAHTNLLPGASRRLTTPTGLSFGHTSWMGTVIGLVAGYLRWLDSAVMRVMDGLMAIPGILLALALVAIWRASIGAVIVAITVPEIPRVGRLVRSLVLSIREEPYVEAAVSVGTPTVKLLYRHILPNTIASLIVQGTYICALAMLVEAILSFLGVGLSTDVPTWGNIMAEGRQDFYAYPHKVLLPGLFLALTVLSVNMLGDGLRDTLDPYFGRRGDQP
jgi:peptide/nickel transport system permease protein